MIRIVGIQRNTSAEREFVLLQNQGSLRVNLRGHVLLSETAIATGDLSRYAHVFPDEVLVPPGMYVLLFTGSGESRWSRTKDGALVFYTYMGRSAPVWESDPGPVNVLTPQHTYVERGPALLLR